MKKRPGGAPWEWYNQGSDVKAAIPQNTNQHYWHIQRWNRDTQAWEDVTLSVTSDQEKAFDMLAEQKGKNPHGRFRVEVWP